MNVIYHFSSQVAQCPSSWERSLPLSLVTGPTGQATTQRTASSHWVCTHDDAHTYAHTYVHTYDKHTHKRMHTHAHINTLIYMYVLTHVRTTQQTHAHTCIYTNFLLFFRPVRYYDNIVYRDIFTNIAIRYFLLAITITAIEILCAKGRGSSTK